jgi:hypothetical protein
MFIGYSYIQIYYMKLFWHKSTFTVLGKIHKYDSIPCKWYKIKTLPNYFSISYINPSQGLSYPSPVR